MILALGNTTFDNPLIQGPLAGISCAPFRRLTWRYSQPAFSCTEMISCKTLIHHRYSSQKRYIEKAADEGPVCFQLSASEPQELAEATKRVTDFGADLIDLNCGCPVNKIRSKGAGSSLLSHPNQLYVLIRAMKQHTHVPVSVKIRVDGRSLDRNNATIAQVVCDAGADFLVVHGRHWSERYDTPCQYDAIQFFVENVPIPVIGNGDIACLSSLQKMLATGCAGVMIGRAGVGQPWLIGQLAAQLKGAVFHAPTIPEIAAIFIEHITTLSHLLGSETFAILQARKMAKYYARTIPKRHAFCDAINRCTMLRDFETQCHEYFNDN